MTATIVLADDHPLVRAGIRALIEKDPAFRVVAEADDGQEAARLALDLRPDIVVMDVCMPNLNGMIATRRVRLASPTTRVVALSIETDAAFVGEMLTAGATGYVVKQGAPEELTAALRAALAGETYLSPRVAGDLVADWIRRSEAEVIETVPVLSDRECEVLQLVAEGGTTKEIALELGVAPKTVEAHRQQIMDKLDLHNVAELTKYAVRKGLTSSE